jgi:hypothetical protein
MLMKGKKIASDEPFPILNCECGERTSSFKMQKLEAHGEAVGESRDGVIS